MYTRPVETNPRAHPTLTPLGVTSDTHDIAVSHQLCGAREEVEDGNGDTLGRSQQPGINIQTKRRSVMNTTQNVKQLKDHEILAQKTKLPASANDKAYNSDWDTITALNQCLAHSIELSSRIKQAHWSAKGENFYVFHKMADDFTAQLAKQANTISARIVAIDGIPKWTVEEVAHASLLPDYPIGLVKVADHIQALNDNYEYVTQQLKPMMSQAARSDDYVTVNVMVSFNKVLDQQKGFLQAHSGLAWLERPKKQYAS